MAIFYFLFAVLNTGLVNPGFDYLLMPGATFKSFPTEEGIWAISGNPAGLAISRDFIILGYSSWLLDSHRSFSAIKLKNIAFSFTYHNFGEFEFQPDVPQDNLNIKFSPYAFDLRATVFRSLDRETRIGFAISYDFIRIYDRETKNLFLHAGFIYQPAKLKNLKFGFSVKNLGFKKKLYQESFAEPAEFTGAISYAYKTFATLGAFAKLIEGFSPAKKLYGIFGDFQVSKFLSIKTSFETGEEIVYPFEVSLKIAFENLGIIASYSKSRFGFDDSKRISVYYGL